MNWNMYLLVFEASKDHSSNLSKIAVMPLTISDVCCSSCEQVFPCKETTYFKVSNLCKL